MDNQDLINTQLDVQELRQNLIRLRQEQQNADTRARINALICRQWEKLTGLFSCEDAKVRKNAALLLGDAGVQASVDALCEGYLKENTLFVRPAFLKALSQLDYRKYIKELAERMKEIQSMEIAMSDRKHIDEERHLLAELLDMAGGNKKHEYSGKVISKVILVIKKGLEDILCNEISEKLPGCDYKKMNGGVMVSTANPASFAKLRTWQSLLFVFCVNNGFDKDSDHIARGIMDSHVLHYLNERHTGNGSWRFRMDVRTRDAVPLKTSMAKKTAFALEALSCGQFVNSISDYEIEFILMEGKNEQIFVYLKLYTIKDDRFAYRKYFTSASMNPVTAAQMIALCRPYFSENANVLDPFCGTGTLLIERKLCAAAGHNRLRSLYGLDTYGEAVEKGRENARLSRCYVNFIHRDFFDFTHEYTFDEVITDPPAVFKDYSHEWGFWEKFYDKIREHLSDKAKLFIFVKNIEIQKNILEHLCDFHIIEKRQLSVKKGTWVLILKHSKEITNN